MHDAWQATRVEVRERARRPSSVVETATEQATLQKGAGAPRPEVLRTTVERAGRPGGKRFGILVHAALAVVPLDADDAAIARVTAVQGRLVGSPANEVDAAKAAVRAALQHDIFQRARASSDVRRECAIQRAVDDGTIVEGVVDLAFLDGDQWLVVDFKTDAELGERLDVYATQLHVYTEALTRATGGKARAVLLSV